jgi:hypothetical protein
MSKNNRQGKLDSSTVQTTVGELIEQLQKFPLETRVVVCGYEGGYNDVSSVEILDIALDVNKQDWMGAHDSAEGLKDRHEIVPAVLLSGSNHNAED